MWIACSSSPKTYGPRSTAVTTAAQSTATSTHRTTRARTTRTRTTRARPTPRPTRPRVLRRSRSSAAALRLSSRDRTDLLRASRAISKIAETIWMRDTDRDRARLERARLCDRSKRRRTSVDDLHHELGRSCERRVREHHRWTFARDDRQRRAPRLSRCRLQVLPCTIHAKCVGFCGRSCWRVRKQSELRRACTERGCGGDEPRHRASRIGFVPLRSNVERVVGGSASTRWRGGSEHASP